MITPAISVLSAVEGLEVASPHMAHFVIPATLVILVLLFAVQRFGTARIGMAFGPVMVLWFLAIATFGILGIIGKPMVVWAVDPLYAVAFFRENGIAGFLILFAVFLVTTGAESLYADLGHFGRTWIRRMWFFFVLPALLLNYFGQGAFLLQHAAAVDQPFYHLIPRMLLYPAVVLATLATIIASQAAITGSFSLTRAAGRLGMMPRFKVKQTSAETSGQVYVPAMNWILMVAVVFLVVMFKTSNALASTYGISISTTMVCTTILAFFIAVRRVHWWWLFALVPLGLGLFGVDLAYFGSNFLRIPDGGWFPVGVGVLFFIMMSTWRRGGELLARQADKAAKPIASLEAELERDRVTRVPGTAVFITPRLERTPSALTLHVRLNHALQEQVVLLTVLEEDVARTTHSERLKFETLSEGFHRVVLRYGYMQQPNVPADLAACRDRGLPIDLDNTTYYVLHKYPVSGRGYRHRDGMVAWRDRLLGFMTRNTIDVVGEVQVPSDRVVDLGFRVRI